MAVNDALTRLAEQSEPASAGQLASFSNIASAVDRLRGSKDLSDADRKAVEQLDEAFTTMHEPQPPADGEQAEDVVVDDATPAEGDNGAKKR